MNAYHVYNTSYLDPKADWGSYDYEENKTKDDVKGMPSPIADDANTESESENDPE